MSDIEESRENLAAEVEATKPSVETIGKALNEMISVMVREGWQQYFEAWSMQDDVQRARELCKCTCWPSDTEPPADNRGPLKDDSHFANCPAENEDLAAEYLMAARIEGAQVLHEIHELLEELGHDPMLSWAVVNEYQARARQLLPKITSLPPRIDTNAKANG